MTTKRRRKTTIRQKIITYVLAIVFTVGVAGIIVNYIFDLRSLETELEFIKQTVEDEMKDITTYSNSAYLMLERYIREQYTKAKVFEPFLEEYYRSGRNIYEMKLRKIKSDMGNYCDLYIIDDGVVKFSLSTMDKPEGADDVIIDFKILNHFYEKYMNLQKNVDEVIIDRISTDVATNKLRIWLYKATPDNKYMMELGILSSSIENIFKDIDIVKHAHKVIESYEIIDDIQIYGVSGELPDGGITDDEEIIRRIKQSEKEGTVEIRKDESNIVRYSYVNFDSEMNPTDNSKVIEVTYNLKPMHNRIRQRLIFFIIATLVVSSIMILGVVIVSNRITRPISKLSEISDSLNKGDLTKEIKVKSNDEIGLLSEQYNEFSSSLKSMVKDIKISTSKAVSVSDNLSRETEQATSSLEQMKRTMETMEERAGVLDKEVESTKQSTKEVKHFINRVVGSISNQSDFIKQLSEMLERMYKSIKDFTEQAVEKMKMTEKLQDTSKIGQKEMIQSVSAITKVGESADLMMEMIGVINSISKKTNLLAMNASIEAAHAGRSGKGFAVVAEEIRKLAEDSATNSQSITESLQEVVGYIRMSEESAEKTGTLFKNIVKEIGEVAESMSEIKSTMDDISGNSTQMINRLTELVNITDNVKSSSSEMESKIESISDSTEKINSISTEVRVGMQETTTGINELYKNIRRVSDSGKENKESVTGIDQLLDRFKTGSESDDDKESGIMPAITDDGYFD